LRKQYNPKLIIPHAVLERLDAITPSEAQMLEQQFLEYESERRTAILKCADQKSEH
jgi:hypothetical protein